MRTQLELGATLDTLNQQELQETVAQLTQNWFQQQARGVKYMRFGPHATTISGSAFTLDGSTLGIGPRSGFVWSIRRLLVTGLATGTTPDVVNFYRNGTSGVPVWQLNGNSFGVTFGKVEMLLLGGETLSAVNSGTVTATGQVTISGDLVEVAAEEIYKLVS